MVHSSGRDMYLLRCAGKPEAAAYVLYSNAQISACHSGKVHTWALRVVWPARQDGVKLENRNNSFQIKGCRLLENVGSFPVGNPTHTHKSLSDSLLKADSLLCSTEMEYVYCTN